MGDDNSNADQHTGDSERRRLLLNLWKITESLSLEQTSEMM